MSETGDSSAPPAPVRVAITGASGPVGTQIAMMIARGDLFGPNIPVELYLVETTKRNMDVLIKGTSVELAMCNFHLLTRVKNTKNMHEAFKTAQYIFLASGVYDNPGFTRNDLIGTNAQEFKEIGLALEAVDNQAAKILVVTEPQNINMFVLGYSSPSLLPKQVTGLSKVDHNRAVAKLAKMLNVTASKITKLSVIGNSGCNIFPDLRHAKVVMAGRQTPAYTAVGDDYYLKFDFVKDINNRNFQVFSKRKATPSLTVANAAIQHMKQWVYGTAADDWTSMVVFSDGSYEVDRGLPYSFPVQVDTRGNVEVVGNLDMDFFEKERLKEAVDKIRKEKNFALMTMGITDSQDKSEEPIASTWSFGYGQTIPCRSLGPLERQRMTFF